jgi:tRNA-dihydrouridine synthase B
MLKEKIILAPLAGCSDLPFRLIAREHGAKFCFFEMVDANSLIHTNNPRKTLNILQTNRKDKPIAAQILGGEPKQVLKAAKILLDQVKVPFLDLNAACPVRKVLKKKSGSYLLKTPETLFKIIKTLNDNLSLPITVKMRVGFNHVNIREIVKTAKGCEKSGAAVLFVHGRTMKQHYGGEIEYEAIKAIKNSVSIPVYGSGNILSPELAKKMLDETNCDGILVARGSFGNPWIFKDIERHLKGKEPKPPITRKERVKIFKRHLKYIDKFKDMPDRGKVGLMRRIALWYFRGFPNAIRTRRAIGECKSREEILKVIELSV